MRYESYQWFSDYKRGSLIAPPQVFFIGYGLLDMKDPLFHDIARFPTDGARALTERYIKMAHSAEKRREKERQVFESVNAEIERDWR